MSYFYIVLFELFLNQNKFYFDRTKNYYSIVVRSFCQANVLIHYSLKTN